MNKQNTIISGFNAVRKVDKILELTSQNNQVQIENSHPRRETKEGKPSCIQEDRKLQS